MEIQGTVRDVLNSKGSEVWTASPKQTVYEALRIMGEKDIGALVVLADDRVIGMISERDYSRKVVLEGRTSRETQVDEILQPDSTTVSPSDSLTRCMAIMTDQHVRHLPVCQDERLIGLISMGDLVRWVMTSQEHTIQQLHGFISGEYPV